MAEIPSTIPAELRSGDTARWRRELSCYPADAGWSLQYSLVGSAGVHSFAATADGSGFLVNVPAGTTATWEPGIYSLQECASKGGDRFTVSSVGVRVLPDLASATAGFDTRTHAQKVLASIEAWLEGKAPTAGSVEVAGRKIQNYDITDLLALRDKYRAEVRREEAAATGNRGRRLLVRI